ncbi:glycosyltransferase family 2 protein [Pedobacter sp.]|uniref:glycosyltransferase family 2 protein n=1 Tax=Pedobacter sp. TaxID=1411316 RepID=UPI003D7FECE0
MNLLVSIVIPCYNQGKFLDTTVKSVLEQSYRHFEIVIVNDGSTDKETLEVLNQNKWDKTTIHHIENSGVSNARNFGISHAKGEYILLLDGDDLIKPTYLEKAIEVFKKNPSVKVVTTEVGYFGKKKGTFNLPEYSLEGLMGQNLMVITSLFRKRDFLLTSGFNSNMKAGFEDWDFWLSFLKEGGSVFKIREVLFLYRISKRSRNSSISLETQSTLRRQIYENHIDLFHSSFFNPLLSFEYTNVVNSKEYRLGLMLLRPLRKVLNALNF